VDPVPDPLLIRNCGSAENRTRTSGFVARNSDQGTTEADTSKSLTLNYYERVAVILDSVAVCDKGRFTVRILY
jgi:hypothetical protein